MFAHFVLLAESLESQLFRVGKSTLWSFYILSTD